MLNEKIRDSLPEETIVFDNPSFDNSIVGLSHDNRAIYDHEKMVEEFMIDHECSYEEAADFISYNTVRGLDYFNEELKPIIMFGLGD